MGKTPLSPVRARDFFAQLRHENPALARVEQELGPSLVLAKNVTRMRIQRGLTQTELAERAGLRQPRIAELEGGAANPKLGTIARVARALAVSTDALLNAPAANVNEYRKTARTTVPLKEDASVPAPERWTPGVRIVASGSASAHGFVLENA